MHLPNAIRSTLRGTAILVGVAALAAASTATVLADGGPHVATVNSGVSTLSADSCAGCHRAHTAQGEMLITNPTVTELCFACHGPASAGATTNVADGVLAATAQALKGGGFVNALMDTSWTGNAVSRPSTSAHAYDGMTTGTIWGSGEIGSGPGTPAVALDCISCHNPHGNGQYRILRPLPVDAPDTAAPIDVDEQSPTVVYTVSSPENRYFGQLYGNSSYDYLWMYQLGEWCAACHTRYDAYSGGASADTGPGHTPSGDPIFQYRHMTRYNWDINCALCHPGSNGINADNPLDIGYAIAHESPCQNCHVAHGSAATMGTYSGSVPWPDAATAPSGNARSSLLRLDNRGVCQGCHNPTR